MNKQVRRGLSPKQNSERVYITECPRDAMQGLKDFIPTELKAKYLNALLSVGFDRLDFGSFVSPKAVPQMKDTAAVLDQLTSETSTELLAIIANLRGAKEAASFDRIRYLGFPFSVSEEFQLRNTNRTREEALAIVQSIREVCDKSNKVPLVYLSMAFGNPYGEEWNASIVCDYAERLYKLGIRHLTIADTTGSSTSDSIRTLFKHVTNELPEVAWSLHLHSNPKDSKEKIEAALESGCRHFDTAVRGFGGCPMAEDSLTGNIATEKLLEALEGSRLPHQLNTKRFREALLLSGEVFGT